MRTSIFAVSAFFLLAPLLASQDAGMAPAATATPAAMATPEVRPAAPEDAERELRRLYLRAGRAFPSCGSPAAPRELERAARALAADAPDDGLRAQARSMAERLRIQAKPVRLRAEALTSLELYLPPLTNDFAGLPESLADRSPFLDARLSIGSPDVAFLYIEPYFIREYRRESWTNFLDGPVEDPICWENDLVRAGIISFPVGDGSLSVGRQAVAIGPSRRNSLLVGEGIPYLDSAVLRLPLGPFTLTNLVSNLNDKRAVRDVDLVGADSTYGYDLSVIFFNAHYVEFASGPFRAGLGGTVTLSRRNNMFQLGDFFPVFSWHSADVGVNNLSLLMDCSWAFLPGFEAFGQFGLDDINQGDVGWLDGGVPTIPAWIAGFRGALDAGPVRLDGEIDSGWTHYLWGNYQSDYGLSRAIYRLPLDGGIRAMSLTSPHGPGCFWIDAQTTARFPAGFSAELGWTFLRRNTLANLFDTPYEASSTVENASTADSHLVSVEGRWRADWLECRMAGSLSIGDEGLVPGFLVGCTVRLAGTAEYSR